MIQIVSIAKFNKNIKLEIIHSFYHIGKYTFSTKSIYQINKYNFSQNDNNSNKDDNIKNNNNRFNFYKSPKYKSIARICSLFLASSFFYFIGKEKLQIEDEITYYEIFRLIEDNKIKEIYIEKDNIYKNIYIAFIETKTPIDINKPNKFLFLTITDLKKFIKDIEQKQIEMGIQKSNFIPIRFTLHKNETKPFPQSLIKPFKTISSSLSFIFLCLGIYTFLGEIEKKHNSISNIKNAIDHHSFTSSKAREYIKGKNQSNITFKDIAGLHQAKKEMIEFIDFLKNPSKYHKLGAKIPHGALLVGPPGTGKTLLAKAIAGEANVPFFSISGSEFDELYVGVGPARVRSLFSMAKERSPCIIFIDELDSVGAKRTGIVEMNDERRKTLNQLLVEMDGFHSNSKIIVLAATNRPDVLDKALLRPGRFDRKIEINLPDKKSREEIITLYLGKIKLNNEYTLLQYAKKLSKITPGFSGADIANLINEAAIISARTNKNSVDFSSFEQASDRLLQGFEMKKILSFNEKKTIAYHEAGHAVINWFLPNSMPLYKISIIPRSKGSLGFNLNLSNESFLYKRENLTDMIANALGGRIAEEMFIGSVTTGASEDLIKANVIARKMVIEYGMSDLGMICYVGNGRYEIQKPFSEEMERRIEKEVEKILKECEDKARKILMEKKEKLEKLVDALIDKETLGFGEIKEILGRKVGGNKEIEEMENEFDYKV